MDRERREKNNATQYKNIQNGTNVLRYSKKSSYKTGRKGGVNTHDLVKFVYCTKSSLDHHKTPMQYFLKGI